MAKVKVICSGCGIWIMTDDSRSTMLCPKCGTEITVKATVNVTQPVQPPVMAGGAELESKLAYAEGLLTAECYDRAEKAFRNIAVLFPEDYRSHWGIVRSGTKNFTDYNGSDYAVDYANAIRNAEEIPLRSMKENYSKYLEERRKSEYERKVGGKLAVFEPEVHEEPKNAIAVPESQQIDLYEVSAQKEEVPAVVEPEEPKEVEKPAVDPNVDFLLREQLNQRLNQHSEACKSAAKELGEQMTEFEEYKEKRKGFVSYQVKQTPPLAELIWFGVFAFLTLMFLVLLILHKPAWLMWPLIIICGIFSAFTLFNLLSELSFKKKIAKRRVQDNGEYERTCKAYKSRIEALQKQMDYHKEQMAAVKRQLADKEKVK